MKQIGQSSADGLGAATRAAKLIKQMIRDGQLKSGDRLPAERELAQRLGVSRPTVREAVRALVAVNLLTARRGAGTYVTSLDPKLLTQPLDFILALSGTTIFSLFEVRKMLEPGAARLAAERAAPDEFQALQDLVDAAARQQVSVDYLVENDIALHNGIVAAARNPLLTSMINSVGVLSAESRAETAQIPSVAEGTQRDHQRIVDALTARDPEASAAAMLDHLTRIEQGVRAALQSARNRPT